MMSVPQARSEFQAPCGNTGVKGAGGPVQVSLDWASFTILDVDGIVTPGWVMERLGGGEWEEQDTGLNGYRRRFKRGGAQVLFDGASAMMGIHVVLSGEALRDLEVLGVVEDWSDWLFGWLGEGARFTRVDLAVDDFDPARGIERVVEAYEAGLLVSRHRETSIIRTRCGEAEAGCTVYLGSPRSETRVRIYDKRAEQKLPAEWGSWVRWEVQARGLKARALAKHLSECGLAEGLGVLWGVVTVAEEARGAQRCRWPVAGWFRDLVGEASRQVLAVQRKVVETVAEVRSWLFRTVSAGFAVVLDSVVDREAFVECLYQVGRARRRVRHELLLARSAL